MPEYASKYVIIGGGLAAASAVEGIREVDERSSIAMVASERFLPYNRPPLSKKLWFGKQTVNDIWIHDAAFYARHGTDVFLGNEAVKVEPTSKVVHTSNGDTFRYEKLLLATGGIPRMLPIDGGDLGGIYYYRYLKDYESLHAEATAGKSAIVVGGGFIGSEIAAVLRINSVNVSIIFPDDYLCARVLPVSVGMAVQQDFMQRGVRVLPNESVESIKKDGARFIAYTSQGREIKSDIVIAGIGLKPGTSLAEEAGLRTDNGVLVNELLQTSHPDIYSAGDCAAFPYKALGIVTRVEHWDNALTQGKQAGRNMAGAGEVYDYMPYFFSDLFDFGYEAVGEVDARMETYADWQEENKTGVIYYLRDDRIRGAMMCNVWDQVPAARKLIQSGKKVSKTELQGVIS